jgi:F-type H+-transporting ATPase subunit delta
MAELATIARPYAEALFRVAADPAIADQIDAVVVVTEDPALRYLADSPKATPSIVFNVISDVLMRQRIELKPPVAKLLQAVIDNARVAVLPAIAAQYRALVNERSGVIDATVYSAFALDQAQLARVLPALEKRFARKLNAHVVEDRELIGGIRVVVGDEVLDTSVRARLEQMKAALTL